MKFGMIDHEYRQADSDFRKRYCKRLLKMQDDYAIRSMKIASGRKRLVIEIAVRE
jgi:hypothetical protein